MTFTRRSRPLLSLSAFLFVASAAAGSAQAQVRSDRTIDAQLFQPAIGPRNFLTVEGAEVPEHKRLSFGLTLNYQRRPFQTFTTGTTEGTSYPIDHQATGELMAAIGLFERFQLGLGVPYTLYLSGDIVDAMGVKTGQRLTENGIGDTRIEAKAQLATLGEDEQYSIGASAGITLPTSKLVDRPYYLGDKSVTGRIKAIGQAQLGPVRAAANLGLLFRGMSTNFATSIGHQLLYGLAAAYELDNRIEIILEAHGRSGLSEFSEFYTDVNPFEVDAAVRWGVTSMWSVMGGGGKGIGNGVGAPQTRLFVAAQFNPDFRDRDHDGVYDIDDKCPDQAEDRDGFNDKDGCPDPDNDNDGIPDAQDKCANDAEDLDQVEDEDGCPDPDNDKDGIPDLNDPCPNAAEDGKGKRPKDGCPSSAEDSDGDGVGDPTDKCVDDPEDRDNFEDEDGCPDPDNDNDGIPDGFDTCPNDAEDGDGFEDEDGCPEPDNDKDGFTDAQDKCPLQAETLNGNKDDDGCPDPGAEIVHLQLADGAGKITVDDRIGFAGGLKNGKPVLKESAAKSVGLVALVLKGHADIKKIRVEVHAEGVSKNETQARADAIKEALVAKGVDAARIEALGAGGGGARVDFIITEMAAPPKPAGGEAPAAP
jgi:outer membrane protein OmpA-like peptidoglycan-associated protein